MSRQHFRPGRSTFTCSGCGKRTRDVDGNGLVDLCPLCFTKSECENHLADNTDHPHPWGVFNKAPTTQACYGLLGEIESTLSRANRALQETEDNLRETQAQARRLFQENNPQDQQGPEDAPGPEPAG